eukprot:scaffold2.g7009.t1
MRALSIAGGEASCSGRCLLQGSRPSLGRLASAACRPVGRRRHLLRAHAALLPDADVAAAAAGAADHLLLLHSLPLSAADLSAAAASSSGADADAVAALADAWAALAQASRACVCAYVWAHPHGAAAAQEALGQLADAASAASAAGGKRDNGWLNPLVDTLEYVLGYIEGGLKKANVPYSYGWSIVALTALIKALTFPLTKIQIESSMSVQQLKPEIDAIKARYGDNKDAISRETNALYEKAGVNPLAGCLPSLATIPIFIGLYRSLSDFASSGDIATEGFYWIPSLAGPTTVAAQRAGAGIQWLYPFIDGVPPVGWETAVRYLVLPVAVVLAQARVAVIFVLQLMSGARYISTAIVAPPVDPNAENAGTQKAILGFLPLMIGWFSLNVPSGLSLYYFCNTVMTSAIQIYLKKLGGADIGDFNLGPIALGKARRTGTAAGEDDGAGAEGEPMLSMDLTEAHAAAAAAANGAGGELAGHAAAEPATPVVNRRCKRRKRLAEVAA